MRILITLVIDVPIATRGLGLGLSMSGLTFFKIIILVIQVICRMLDRNHFQRIIAILKHVKVGLLI